jgi:type II secretory pathway pseudopilin PulG
MLVVIAIIGILAGILTVGATAAVRKNKLTRVTVELRQLETAIESYKADKGYYPPDNGLPPVIVGKPFQAPDTERTNTLYYELSGMTLTANGGYQTLDGQETLAGPLASLQSALTNTFGLNNFHNAGAAGAAARQADDAPIAKSFIKFKANQTATFSEPVKTGNYTFRVLNVPVEGGDKSDFNPWRYNSHNPTNNPDSYDLWAEFLIGSKTNIICNWSHNVIAK